MEKGKWAGKRKRLGFGTIGKRLSAGAVCPREGAASPPLTKIR